MEKELNKKIFATELPTNDFLKGVAMATEILYYKIKEDKAKFILEEINDKFLKNNIRFYRGRDGSIKFKKLTKKKQKN